MAFDIEKKARDPCHSRGINYNRHVLSDERISKCEEGPKVSSVIIFYIGRVVSRSFIVYACTQRSRTKLCGCVASEGMRGIYVPITTRRHKATHQCFRRRRS